MMRGSNSKGEGGGIKYLCVCFRHSIRIFSRLVDLYKKEEKGKQEGKKIPAPAKVRARASFKDAAALARHFRKKEKEKKKGASEIL
jgi:hypothetical protein